MMLRFLRSYIQFVVLVAVLLSPLDSYAAEEVGQVVALRGKVTATNEAGETRSLAIKSSLFLDDTIKTDKRARLQILFSDNSIISLGKSTIVKIAEYGWDPAKNKAAMNTEVKEGVFRVMGGLISKKNPEKFKTTTPVATIGIRGSMYAGEVGKDGLTIMLEGGKGINLTNATGTVPVTTPGFGSRVESWNASITEPKKFSSQAIQGLQQRMGHTGQGPSQFRVRVNKVPQSAAPPSEGGLSEPASGVGMNKPPAGEQQADMPPEMILKLEQITDSVKENPENALKILQTADSKGITVDQALGAVLVGMQNVDRQTFDSLINEALDQGLTLDKAKDIAREIAEKGGGCQ